VIPARAQTHENHVLTMRHECSILLLLHKPIKIPSGVAWKGFFQILPTTAPDNTATNAAICFTKHWSFQPYLPDFSQWASKSAARCWNQDVVHASPACPDIPSSYTSALLIHRSHSVT